MSVWQHKTHWLVNHHIFDNVIAGIIFSHGIFVGMQTQDMFQRYAENPSLFFQIAELAFCIVYTVELAARLFAYRCEFFTNAQRFWNIFEFTIVRLQLLELMLLVVASRMGFAFSILRLLRVLRVVRLARALQLIRELKLLVSCITASVKPLFWSCILLFMVAYVAGVALSQLIHAKTVQLISNGEEIPAKLEEYWGGLFKAIWTLVQVITGGVDWNQVARPLTEHVSVEAGVIFTCYILFTHLAML